MKSMDKNVQKVRCVYFKAQRWKSGQVRWAEHWPGCPELGEQSSVSQQMWLESLEGDADHEGL